MMDIDLSGPIIATSHDLTPSVGLVRDIPLFLENLRLVKYYNLARCIYKAQKVSVKPQANPFDFRLFIGISSLVSSPHL